MIEIQQQILSIRTSNPVIKKTVIALANHKYWYFQYVWVIHPVIKMNYCDMVLSSDRLICANQNDKRL